MASFFVVEDHALTSLGIRGVLSEQPDFVCAGFASQKGEALQKLSVLLMYVLIASTDTLRQITA